MWGWDCLRVDNYAGKTHVFYHLNGTKVQFYVMDMVATSTILINVTGRRFFCARNNLHIVPERAKLLRQNSEYLY